MEYSDNVIRHYTSPQNVGSLPDANGVGQVGNPVCGDIMKIYIRVEDEVIRDVKFKTFGCGAAVASSSITTELIKGKTVDEALSLKNTDVVDALGGLPPVKLHCSVLAEEAIHEAIADYYRRQGRLSEAEIQAKCGLKAVCAHCATH